MDKNKIALDALTEWQISRATGNADLEHEKATMMLKAVRSALTEASDIERDFKNGWTCGYMSGGKDAHPATQGNTCSEDLASYRKKINAD